MSNVAKRRKLRKLFDEARAVCHWCGVVTHLWTEPVGLPPGHHRRRPPHDSATIDHLRDRYDPTRHVPPRGQERRLVLACWKCNNDRNRVRQAAVPIEERQRRARRGVA